MPLLRKEAVHEINSSAGFLEQYLVDKQRDQKGYGNSRHRPEYGNQICHQQFPTMGQDHRHQLVPAIGCFFNFAHAADSTRSLSDFSLYIASGRIAFLRELVYGAFSIPLGR